ncbi:MAG: DNA polymerase IV [Anaerolineae bacterium]
MGEPKASGDQPRAIVHLDLDAFFAAVEVIENPALAGQPLIVGGRPEERGVVASSSYPARAFGVRSAMPMSRALALCPGAIVVPPRHQLYADYSRRVMDLLHQASPRVEQASIDEAYLDLTDLITEWEQAADLARQIQQRVREEIGLSSSLGVATNKLVAKIAADQHKPGGLTVVRPGEEAAFLAPLPVEVLWGVGPVTARKLAELRISTVGELAQAPEEVLRAHFGRHGSAMARQARGEDKRPVVTEHQRKSLSQERTFRQDLTRVETLEQELQRLSQEVGRHLQNSGLAAGTIALKLRYADFTTLTRQMTLAAPTNDASLIYQTALALFRRSWERGRPVRLLGVSGRHLSPPVGQFSLWG